MEVEVDASATVAAGLAVRLAALRARQQLTAHTSGQTQNHDVPAAISQNMAEAQQQQQQQQQDEDEDQHGSVLNRLRVLQQRQGSHQQQQQVVQEEDLQGERVPTGRLDTLQQPQPLHLDQQQQDSSQAEQQHQKLQQQQDTGQAKHQQQKPDHTAAELLQKMVLLHSRQAKEQQQQQQQPAADLQGDQLQHPDDFIHCLRDVLASEDFPVSLDHADCEDVDEVDGESSGAAAAAAAGDEPDPGWHAEGIAQQQAGPHVCGSSQGRHQDRSEETGVMQHQQQQQCDQQHQQQQQQQVAPDQTVPSHARSLLVLTAQSITAGHYTEARIRAAAAAAAAASFSGGNAVASFCRESLKLSSIALLLEAVPQQQWFAALQLIGPETADTNPAAAAKSAPGCSSATAQDVQRSYRRLAALVHPDKCRHPCAEAAFKALSTAYDQALRVLGSQGVSNPMSDMHDSAGFRDGFGHGFGPTDPGSCNPSADGNSDYAWWSEWERDVSAGFVDGAAAAGGGGSSTVPTAADEEEELWRISMEDLVAEVERRQAGALRPQCQADAARPALERQKRLRVARTVLSARMQQHRQASVAAMDDSDGAGLDGGGFMCDDDVGGQQTAGWKRQRV